MPAYKASQVQHADDQQALAALLAERYLAPGRPQILELSVRYIGAAGTGSREYVIDLTFKSELPEPQALQLAQDLFGAARGFRELPVPDPVEIDWSTTA